MARILYGTEWFEEITSRGHSEHEYEKILQQEANKLFPNYYFVPFKTTVYSELDSDFRAPDFALIHRTYSAWWVVEIELGHHSFHGHVLPQVTTLSRAMYGRDEALYLCHAEPRLNQEKVLQMFKGAPPRVLVIVNSSVDHWAEWLKSLHAKVFICQLFRSRLNKYILRIDGEYPTENDEVGTLCECSVVIHRYLHVHAPNTLPISKDEKVLLSYKGRASEWQRVDTSDQVYLHAVRGHDLKPGKRYRIVRQDDGVFSVQPETA